MKGGSENLLYDARINQQCLSNLCLLLEIVENGVTCISLEILY